MVVNRFMTTYSRKEVREKLNISDATLRRWLKDLEIGETQEVLRNGVISYKIPVDGFLKLQEHNMSLQSKKNTETNALNKTKFFFDLKTEIMSLQSEKVFHTKLLEEKERFIENLKEQNIKQEEKIDVLFDEFKRLNEELRKEQTKGFFKRIFG